MLMPVRSTNRMSLLDCVGLGINGIIGTGIFLLPARVFTAAGGFSWAAWLAIGGVCIPVGLHYRGIKPGALASDFFSGAKLLPLLFFVAVGLFFVDWGRVSIPPPNG